ncbi:DoxX-like family protein [Acinetobacter qingfengensis]|uniref:DoxX-like family protein n=1 Tax=Acinetobacter qingfengensis TaxID=1262585 RepID=A0A1E7RFT9_9GAMM|nr:DoxX-like family protein [Acinetobacter qingfengensis]KAA8731862.1 DoxX-like family protein [Acinetobacter qingfengensis]OEY98015.1 DoxX-like family protein [Acinetobacter qingfengensis]
MSHSKIIKFIYIILGSLWVYQGIFPKLIFTSPDEIAIWQWVGLSEYHAKLAGQTGGVIEIIFGLFLIFYPLKILHYLNILGLLFLLVLMSLVMPDTLIRAFNPVVMNVAMISLSCIALMLYHAKQNNYSE